jgi:hypothetical protein
MKQMTSIISSKINLADSLRALDLKILFTEDHMYEKLTREFIGVFEVVNNLPRHNTRLGA